MDLAFNPETHAGRLNRHPKDHMDTTRHRETIALVTGAASGIGRAIAMRLAGEGATVVATDVTAGGLATLASERPDITTVTGDLCDQSFVDELVRRVEDVGPIGVLANVAGIMDHFVPVGEVDDALWTKVLDINLNAAMRLCRAVLPLMAGRGGGAIVNIVSAAGLGGAGAGAAYTASKHAMIGLTKHVAFTYALDGIRCNAVCPGGVKTGIGPSAAPAVPWAYERHMSVIAVLAGLAEPDEIATLASWLASSEASYVNGAIVSADGGWKAA